MVKVDNKNRVIVEEKNDMSAAARCAVMVHGLAKRFDEQDPKFALAFLRSIHNMVNSMAAEIVKREDQKFDDQLEAKLKAKFGDDYKEKMKAMSLDDWEEVKAKMKKEDEELEKEGLEDGDTNRSNTESGTGDGTNAGEFDGIKEDKSAVDRNATGTADSSSNS